MEKLHEIYHSYHPEPKIEKIYKAYELAEVAYYGEKRLNGEDWINYALEVAKTAAELRLDTASICAALLVDAYKFGLSEHEIATEVDRDVSTMLNHLEDIRAISNRYNITNLNQDYADYIRRLILATGKDVRVVAIRLIQKLHSIESIYVFDEDHQKFIFKKAFEVYTPLAELIGMGLLHGKLSETAFKISDHKNYLISQNILSTHFFSKDYRINALKEKIGSLFVEKGISDFDISARVKNSYSFYLKAIKYSNRSSNEFIESGRSVHDKVAFRVVLPDVEACYKALDVVQERFPVLQDNTDDYIKNPKPNGYQSIHLIVDLGNKNYGEIQIRTRDMHQYNEYGHASHFFYKLSLDKSQISDSRIRLIQNMLQWKESIFEEDKKTKIDKFDSDVLVFTPKGDVISLPTGATIIDFAYSVHTKLGDTATKAFVNGKVKPLSTELQSGDVVEIIADKFKKYPSEEWLNFAVTKRARISVKKGVAKKKSGLH